MKIKYIKLNENENEFNISHPNNDVRFNPAFA